MKKQVTIMECIIMTFSIIIIIILIAIAISNTISNTNTILRIDNNLNPKNHALT